MKRKLLIGTKNPGKIKRWSHYFCEHFDVVSLRDCEIDMDIEESMDDLLSNSIKKAKTYAQLSGLLTLSEDTGFFLEELGGKPGVAVRRWGGELPNEISDEDFLEFFKDKVQHLQNTRGYFEYEVTLSTPEGKVRSFNKKSYGNIDKQKLYDMADYENGYPISHCFVSDFDGKTWFECSNEEREKRDESLIQEIRNILDTL